MTTSTSPAAQATSINMNIRMDEMGMKKTTSFEKMRKSVVGEFGEAKIKALADHKASIKSLKQKNVTENVRAAFGVVAGVALTALGIAGFIGALILTNIATIPVALLIIGAFVSLPARCVDLPEPVLPIIPNLSPFLSLKLILFRALIPVSL